MARSWLALAVLVAACGDPTGPNTDDVVVSMVRQGTGETTVVAISLDNRSDRAITNNCQAIFLERATDEGWVMAWGPTCIQPDPPAYVILQPGESRTVTLDLPGPGRLYRPVAVVRVSGHATDRLVIGAAERW